jgi:hypothetical protein
LELGLYDFLKQLLLAQLPPWFITVECSHEPQRLLVMVLRLLCNGLAEQIVRAALRQHRKELSDLPAIVLARHRLEHVDLPSRELVIVLNERLLLLLLENEDLHHLEHELLHDLARVKVDTHQQLVEEYERVTTQMTQAFQRLVDDDLDVVLQQGA